LRYLTLRSHDFVKPQDMPGLVKFKVACLTLETNTMFIGFIASRPLLGL
jgi:hypothetical protein